HGRRRSGGGAGARIRLRQGCQPGRRKVGTCRPREGLACRIALTRSRHSQSGGSFLWSAARILLLLVFCYYAVDIRLNAVRIYGAPPCPLALARSAVPPPTDSTNSPSQEGSSTSLTRGSTTERRVRARCVSLFSP